MNTTFHSAKSNIYFYVTMDISTESRTTYMSEYMSMYQGNMKSGFMQPNHELYSSYFIK